MRSKSESHCARNCAFPNRNNTMVAKMMRMMLEIVMVLGLVGGITFVMTAMAKENKRDKALLNQDRTNDAEKSPDNTIKPEAEE